jgi:L-asparaginase II
MPVLAEVIRSGFVESRHRGSAVAIGADGRQMFAVGDVATAMFPRSSNKPLQATAMVARGLDLEGKLLALAAASHSGEDFHVAGVREILARAGLTEDALRCPPSLPLDEEAMERLLAEGGRADRIHMNCSGKHAAMLATSVANGWPTQTYLDPGHPLQQWIKQEVARLAGEEVAATGVDGCGAPLFALSLTGLASAFRAIVLAGPNSPERAVADSVSANPDWASGTQRTERALMEAVPGLLMKPGAEAVQAFALADGRAGAFKIEDGNHRAVPAVTVAMLRLMGVGGGDGAAVDEAALERVADVPVYGGGRVVGRIRSVLPV